MILLFGLRLAGIEYFILNKKEDVIEKLQDLIHQNEIGIIVITEELYNLVQDEIQTIQSDINIPLIVKIPNRNEM